MRKLELHRYDDGVELHLGASDVHQLISILYKCRRKIENTKHEQELAVELEEKLDRIINQEPEVNRVVRISDSWVVEINDTVIKLYEKTLIGRYVVGLILPTERVLLAEKHTWTVRTVDLDKQFDLE